MDISLTVFCISSRFEYEVIILGTNYRDIDFNMISLLCVSWIFFLIIAEKSAKRSAFLYSRSKRLFTIWT